MSFLSNLFSGGAGTLVDSVGSILDKITTTKEELMQQDLEMRKAQMQFQLDQNKLLIDQQKNLLEDIDSARRRSAQIETSTAATGLSKNITAFLAIGSTVLTFALFYIVIFRNEKIIPEVKDVVLYVLGVLSAILTQVFSFYFGSSTETHRFQEKDTK